MAIETGTKRKVRNNIVYTSSYDRGLEHLLEMWPDIRQAIPDATLDIYYGFNMFDVSHRAQTDEGKAWKAKMQRLFQQEGVSEHGRVNSDDVAKAYQRADIWAYPSDFPEIDCITATKAMAAKCVPVTTDYAVLKERNQGVLVEGSGADPDVREEFKKQLIALMKDEKRKERIRSKLSVTDYHWNTVAYRWHETLSDKQTENPLVSVIIPTYNRPEYLKEAVASAMEQTYPNKEIIVVDDGSDAEPDLPVDVKYIRLEQNSGSSSVPLNRGIEEAQGEYIFNMGDDDKFWSRHSLAHYMDKAVKTGADLVFSDLMLAWPDKEQVFVEPFTTWEELKERNTLPGVYLIKSGISKKVPYDPEYKYGQDYERHLRFAKLNLTVAKVSNPLYWFRQHDDHIQSKNAKEQTAMAEEAREQHS